MPKSPKLSIVIPVYNEEYRLEKSLPQILQYFSSQNYTFELILVDDGSSDKTVTVAKNLSKHKKNVSIVSLPINSGKGAALKKGFSLAQGSWILFMDADLSTPLEELEQFWPFTKNYSVIIGSRKTKGSKVTARQGFVRENLGKVFTALTNVIAAIDVTDVTCGFKLFDGAIGKELFSLSQLSDWSFDAEILFVARKKGYKIKEVPVRWQNDPRTKVNLVKDSINSLLGLIKIRINDSKKVYS